MASKDVRLVSLPVLLRSGSGGVQHLPHLDDQLGCLSCISRDRERRFRARRSGFGSKISVVDPGCFPSDDLLVRSVLLDCDCRDPPYRRSAVGEAEALREAIEGLSGSGTRSQQAVGALKALLDAKLRAVGQGPVPLQAAEQVLPTGIGQL